MPNDVTKATIEKLEHKISQARTRLILDHPFLGALVLRLPLQAAGQWCQTTATDAKRFYYNPAYVSELHMHELQFVLAHEALHCGLSHFSRRGHRNKMRWDVACDYAINPILIEEGLQGPPGTLYERSYTDMTAEEIYPLIDENPDVETMDQHMYDSGSGEDGGNPDQSDKENDQPPPDNAPKDQQQTEPEQKSQQQPESDPESKGGQSDAEPEPQQQPSNSSDEEELAPPPQPLTPQEKETLQVQWQQRLAGAAQQAIQAGKMGAATRRLVDHMLQPQLPWRMLLARYVNGIARDDYTFSRPSSRRGDFGGAIFPSLRSSQANMVVAIDVSGSVSEKEMGLFLSEVNAIKGQMRCRITLLACDAELSEDGPWVFEPWEEFSLPRSFKGGGGTKFTPVFDWCNRQDRQPDLVLYFTDARGIFPEQVPAYPVIWLVKGREPVPWGQRVQLN